MKRTSKDFRIAPLCSGEEITPPPVDARRLSPCLVARSVLDHEGGDDAVGLGPGSGHARRPVLAQPALQAPQQCLSDQHIMRGENPVAVVLSRKRLGQRTKLAVVVQTADNDRQRGHELALLFVHSASEQGTNLRRNLEQSAIEQFRRPRRNHPDVVERDAYPFDVVGTQPLHHTSPTTNLDKSNPESVMKSRRLLKNS